MFRVFVFLGCMVTIAFAEVFEFTDTPIPANLTLTSHYLFHVYSNSVGSQENQQASVTFKNFQIKWSDGKAGIGDYQSLQVSLIPWSKFFTMVDGNNFCSRKGSLTLHEGAEVPIFNVGKQQEANFPVTATDAYLLTVTNCGDRTGATITKGEVIVKQPHGYLPGNKIWTLQWWGWFTLIMAFICIMWAIAAARHYKALVFVQKAIAGCAVIALLEAAMAYVAHKQWNRTGVESPPFEVAMMCSYSLKYVLTLRMLLETAAGAGVIMQKLEYSLTLKMDGICAVFISLQWMWKMILSDKYRYMISTSFLVAITVPGTLLWVFLFIWIYRKFHVLWTQVQEKKLASEAVTLFINMRLVLVGSILLATVVLLIQCTDIVTSATPWNLQWLPYEGCPHSVYTLFLLALMILWWPNADSWKVGYTEQVTQDEQGDCEVKAEQVGVAQEEEL